MINVITKEEDVEGTGDRTQNPRWVFMVAIGSPDWDPRVFD